MSIRIEAETMDLTAGYRLESGRFASGGQFIGLVGGNPAETGTASFSFSGPSGLYDVIMGYFDEGDGVSHLEVYKQGTSLDAWDFNKNLGSNGAGAQTLTSRIIASSLLVNAGETIELRGSEDRGEPARIDYIEFIPVNTPPSLIRIEAETMSRGTYRVKSGSSASGGQFISLPTGAPAQTGTASFAFSGSSGLYDVVVAYFDETDGIGHLEVRKQGSLIDTWDLNQNRGSAKVSAQTRTRRTIATELVVNQGETLQIQGIENNGEAAGIDYIEFIPVTPATINGTGAAEILRGDAKDNTVNGFAGDDTLIGRAGDNILDGGNGIDTVDYTQATNGIIASLGTGIVLAPVYGALAQPKVMPLGDSITAGQHTVSPTPGAYRIQLWSDFLADGLSVNFVGSQSNGPDSLGDKDHEGHPGWKINQITGLVTGGLLETHQPDVVMLMIGTNDTKSRSLSQMYVDLSNLIDQIAGRSPNTQLVVTSIAPKDPAVKGEAVANKVKDFNALLPDLVSDKAAQGKKVSFVNVGGSLTLSDMLSDGVHPTAAGYNKMGDLWYDVLVERDTLIGIENITGTSFGDKLVGNAGINVIKGGTGNDILTGGDGVDTFIYGVPTEGEDTIIDFGVNDIFSISASGFGGGLQVGTALSTTDSPTGVFVSSLDPTPGSTSANFLYKTDTGLLIFDGDGTGSGAAVAIATLSGAPSLSANQFTIVS